MTFLHNQTKGLNQIYFIPIHSLTHSSPVDTMIGPQHVMRPGIPVASTFYGIELWATCTTGFEFRAVLLLDWLSIKYLTYREGEVMNSYISQGYLHLSEVTNSNEIWTQLAHFSFSITNYYTTYIYPWFFFNQDFNSLGHISKRLKAQLPRCEYNKQETHAGPNSKALLLLLLGYVSLKCAD